LNKAQMGIALSAFFWFYLLMNIPAGALADRYGAKRTLAWAAALWSICSAGTGLAKNLLQLIMARVGVRVGASASFPVNAKIVNNSFPAQQRGLAVAFYTAGLRLGFAVTPALMAVLIKRWGWRSAFFISGLGSLAWVVLWWLTCVEPRPAEAPAATASNKMTVAELLRNRTVIGLVLCKFFQDYLFYLFVTWLPGYLVLSRGFSLLQMGWYASLPWIAGCIAQPVAGWVSDRLIAHGVSVTMSRKSIVIAMQLLAALVVVAGQVRDPMAAVWLLTLSVACESAEMAGVMNTAGALAGILAPSVTGYLAESSGSFQLPLLVGSVMVLLAAAAMWFVVGELKPVSREPAAL
jgi:MFS family permease